MNNEENHEDTCEGKTHIWDPSSRRNVLTLAIIKDGYSKNMQEMTNFGKKDCLLLPSLGWKMKEILITEMR